MNPSRSVFKPPGEPEAPTNVTAPARDDPSLDPVLECWFELERYLEQRTRELNAEVRGYPRPIAHCDDQLPKLLEQRARANEQLQRAWAADAAAPSPLSGPWLEVRRQILASPMVIEDDPTETAIRARLREMLSGLHGLT